MKITRKNLIVAFCVGILLGMIVVPAPPVSAPITITSPFVYSFNKSGTVNEVENTGQSTSPYWWVNSGGEMDIESGMGQTMQGNAPFLNKWRITYARTNPEDTDKGLRPQNIFRLVTRSKWENVSAQAWFYIVRDNFSASPNRNLSNGLLIMSRYTLGGQTLYYAGIRVDGTAVIKKKYNGTYYTMAQEKIFPGTYSGDRDNKNLIPHNAWIGLRSNTATNTDGSVTVALYMQNQGEEGFTKLLEATDRGQYGNTKPITGTLYMGLRTDFMDVNFKSFRLQNL